MHIIIVRWRLEGYKEQIGQPVSMHKEHNMHGCSFHIHFHKHEDYFNAIYNDDAERIEHMLRDTSK